MAARSPPRQSTSYDIGLSADAAAALENYRKKDASKVVVRFKAVGNAPIMKQNFYKITASNRFQAVIQFLRKELSWKSSDPLFTYINLAFSPAPDDIVANLYKVKLDNVSLYDLGLLTIVKEFCHRWSLDSQLQYYTGMGLIHPVLCSVVDINMHHFIRNLGSTSQRPDFSCVALIIYTHRTLGHYLIPSAVTRKVAYLGIVRDTLGLLDCN